MHQLPVYLYDLDNNLLKIFETTQECADFFEKPRKYINSSLCNNDKIRKDGIWYRIRRFGINK